MDIKTSISYTEFDVIPTDEHDDSERRDGSPIKLIF